MHHLLNWIEIPVTDMSRARRFYETVLGVELVSLDVPGMNYALFPAKDRFNSGALVQGPGYEPAATGPLVYLDAQGRIDTLLQRAVVAGGRVLMPKTYLSPEAGEVAIIQDLEGNRLGLQSAVRDEAVAPVSDETMQRLLSSTERNLTFLLRKGPAYDDPARQHLQWEHARNMFTLLRAGKLRLVTALMDGTDILGVGSFHGTTRDEAEQLLREDPGVRGGRLTAELLSGVSFLQSETQF